MADLELYTLLTVLYCHTHNLPEPYVMHGTNAQFIYTKLV